MSGNVYIEKEVKVLGIDAPSVVGRLKEIGAKNIFSGMTYIEGFERLQEGQCPDLVNGIPPKYETIVTELRTISPRDQSLISAGAYLRLRAEGSKQELILKIRDPESDSKIKVERELSIHIEKEEWRQAELLLESIGFTKTIRQQKFRVSYIYEPLGVRYDIDTWPKIPTYLEVEAPSEEAITAGLRLLDIDPAKATSISGKELFEVYNIDPSNLFFENEEWSSVVDANNHKVKLLRESSPEHNRQ